MTLDGKGVVNRGVGRDETLGLALGLEALHLSLSSPDRKMRVLGPVVLPQSPRTVLVAAALSVILCAGSFLFIRP